MALTLKEILNDVLSQSGFLERAGFISSTDVDDKQMIAIGNRVAIELRDYFNWTKMRKSFTLTMIEGQSRYKLPSDWLSVIPDSAWETNGNRRVELPVADSRWFMYKFTTFSDGGTLRARFYGDEIEVRDVEPGETFTLEYMSSSPIKSADGSLHERWQADSDVWTLDDQLIVLGVQAHWAQTKVFPQAQTWMMNYLQKRNEAVARDTGARTVGGPTGPDRDAYGSPYYPLYQPS